MTLTRWQPYGSLWNQMENLQTEMNRLFGRWGTGTAARAFAPTFPALNVWEDGDHVIVEAELPGMEPKDIDIHVTGGNQLTIKGERKSQVREKAVVHRQERGFGSFLRGVTLPFSVNTEKVDAHFENGVLRVKLAKHESALPRKIVVKG